MKHLLIIAGVAVVALLTASGIRGIRNNNWLNIKFDPDNDFIGQTGYDSKGFARFSHPIYSLRAGFRLLNTYKQKGIDTIESIITRFAPSTENPTTEYIKTVSKLTGISPSSTITAFEWPRVLQAMVKVEVGKSVPIDRFYQAQQMAF